MDFDARYKYLRKHPNFMVAQEIEVKAVAFASREVSKPEEDDFVLGTTENGVLVLAQEDIEKILSEYPDLADKFK